MANHGIALVELVAYMNEARMDGTVAPVFKVADLVKVYSNRPNQFRVKQHDHAHSTCLKNCILAQFPELVNGKERCDVLPAFDKDLGRALRKATEHDCMRLDSLRW